MLEQLSGNTCVCITELSCKNTLGVVYFFCVELLGFSRHLLFLFFCFHGHSQQVVGKAASILPVIILLKLPKKRRIRKQKKKGQLINQNMSQPG